MKIITSQRDLPEGFTLESYPAVFDPRTQTYHLLGQSIPLKEIVGYVPKIPHCTDNYQHARGLLKFQQKVLGGHFPDIEQGVRTAAYLKEYVEQYSNLKPFCKFIHDNDCYTYMARSKWIRLISEMRDYVDIDGLDMQDRHTVEREVKVTNFNDSKVKVNDRCWIKSERGALRAIGVVKEIKETSLILKIEHMGAATHIKKARLFPIITDEVGE